MEINVNIPNVYNTPSLRGEDELVLMALEKPVDQRSVSFLRSRPKVAPYHLGSVYGRIVSFDFWTVFDSKASNLDNAIALEALLAGLVAANLVYLQCNTYPKLYSSGVRYERTQVWDALPAVLYRGYGDCKSLSAMRIAEMAHEGLPAKAVFRWMPREDNVKDFHILIHSALGYEDPSRKCGMGRDENAYFKL